MPASELYDLIDNYFDRLNKTGILLEEVLVSFESAPMQAGRFTTAQTLISLGKSHAVLDLYCYRNNIAEYDYVGVAPITTHSYFKKIKELDSKAPVEKEDIHQYVIDTYGLDTKFLDESDAVFLAQTLLECRWDKDITEKIKEIKRHRKTLKAAHAIKSCDEEIARLNELKINK